MNYMSKFCILDTSICSSNVGDQIIMDAVNNELAEINESNDYCRIPTHEKVSRVSWRLLQSSECAFVGGTNLLTSKMNQYRQWKIGILDSVMFNNVVLMGVGWWQYQDKPNIYTKTILKNLLSGKFIHSVRDSYTESMLRSIGIKNVITTGCPTLWGLTENFCKKIKKDKSPSVVFTLTDYKKDVDNDKFLLEIISKNYGKKYFWPQGSGDLEYFLNVGGDRLSDLTILGSSLRQFDSILKDDDVEYVGTRLHAGIRALQNMKRSIIISIDNRAKEMSKDFGLNIVERNNLGSLEEYISRDFETKININKNIEVWKAQFEGKV